MVTTEGNIGAGKTTFLQKFKHSLSGDDKVTIKIKHGPVKRVSNFL